MSDNDLCSPATLRFYDREPHATRVTLDEATPAVRDFYRGIVARSHCPGRRTVSMDEAIRRLLPRR